MESRINIIKEQIAELQDELVEIENVKTMILDEKLDNEYRLWCVKLKSIEKIPMESFRFQRICLYWLRTSIWSKT